MNAAQSHQLQTVEYLADRVNVSVARAYTLTKEVLPLGVVVRLGRHVRIDPVRLEEFLARGGQALSGGWRRDGGQAA